jgi:hypothetical protein
MGNPTPGEFIGIVSEQAWDLTEPTHDGDIAAQMAMKRTIAARLVIPSACTKAKRATATDLSR